MLQTFLNSYGEALRLQLVVGINAVGERIHELGAVFVCLHDVIPRILVNHLPLMCALNSVPLVLLPAGASLDVGRLLQPDFHVKRAICIGVLKENAAPTVSSLLDAAATLPQSSPDATHFAIKKIPASRR